MLYGGFISTYVKSTPANYYLTSVADKRQRSFYNIAHPSYLVISDTTTLKQGLLWQFTLHTLLLPVGTTLYWTIRHISSHAEQFNVNSGVIVTIGDKTSFSIQTYLNTSLTNNVDFIVEIRVGRIDGTVVAESPYLTILA
jgi:hypothetical protein